MGGNIFTLLTLSGGDPFKIFPPPFFAFNFHDGYALAAPSCYFIRDLTKLFLSKKEDFIFSIFFFLKIEIIKIISYIYYVLFLKKTQRDVFSINKKEFYARRHF